MTFTHKKVVTNYILCKINFWAFVVGKDFALGSSLRGAIKLIKKADPDN